MIPHVMEFTLINKMSSKSKKKISYKLLHKHDSISDVSLPDIILPEYFYR